MVYIVQENHSFDNVLGAWCAETKHCNGATTGTLYGGHPIRLTKANDIVARAEHTVHGQTTAIDGGKMDGFSLNYFCTAQSDYACYTQYQPSEIPNIIALANGFTVSDATFEDGPAPSWGSHLDAVAATFDAFTGDLPRAGTDGVLGAGWGCDSGYDAPWRSSSGKLRWEPACVPDYALDPTTFPYGGAYRPTPVAHVNTIMDELDTAGISWKIYAGLGGTGNGNGYGWAICPSFADCRYTQEFDNVVQTNNVVKDAHAGALPSFSVVTPTQVDSQHNEDSMAIGDNWIGQVVSSIENGPDWSSTAIFLTWDDCGCFYDHVTPPPGLGIRVPMVIISPYAKSHSTDSTVADFASVLAFTEHNFGLSPLGSEDASAYDYSGAFDYSQTPLAPVAVTNTPISSAELQYLKAHPPDPDDPT